MNTSTLSLCLLALAFSASSVACTAGATDDDGTSEGSVVAQGVPGSPIIAPVLVTGGEFTLQRQAAPGDLPSPFFIHLTIAGGFRGQAIINTACLVCGGDVKTQGLPDFNPGQPEGEPTGVPGLPFDPPARNYEIFATKTACGKIYSGGTGPSSVTIHDYRHPSPSCALDIAAELTVEETVNGVKTTYLGQAVEVDPT